MKFRILESPGVTIAGIAASYIPMMKTGWFSWSSIYEDGSLADTNRIRYPTRLEAEIAIQKAAAHYGKPKLVWKGTI